MQLSSKTTVAPALKSLLENLIDYAGVFPPASLTLDVAVENYRSFRSCDYSWMLRSFVVSAAAIEGLPEWLNGHIALLSEADQSRAFTIESKTIVKASRPVYCELGLDKLQQLDEIKAAGIFAKLRTGGLVPEAIPSPADVARFINACAERRLAFKATAGLHHPIRAEQPLTYQSEPPRAVLHGFINVVLASAFAWHGDKDIEPIIAERDATAFSFDDGAHWRGKSLTINQVQQARREFIHSIGSCSFDEPVHDLKALGLLS